MFQLRCDGVDVRAPRLVSYSPSFLDMEYPVLYIVKWVWVKIRYPKIMDG